MSLSLHSRQGLQNLELRFHSTQFGAAPVAVDPNAAAVLLSHRLSLCACVRVCVWSVVFLCLMLGGWPWLLLLLPPRYIFLRPRFYYFAYVLCCISFRICKSRSYLYPSPTTPLSLAPQRPSATAPQMPPTAFCGVCVCAPEWSPTGCFKNPKTT